MSEPRKKQIDDGSALQRKYTTDQLRDLWTFVRCDFDRFLELLVWLDGLK
jgi:hypothetical protein